MAVGCESKSTDSVQSSGQIFEDVACLLISDDDIRPVANTDTLTLRNETLPLCRLSTYFGATEPAPETKESYVVVAAIGQRRLGLQVDLLLGQQDVVIKPLGDNLGTERCFSGATDIGEERLALVQVTLGLTS